MFQGPGNDPLRAVISHAEAVAKTQKTVYELGQKKSSAPLKVNFSVHNAQQHILADPHRFLTLVCGRRFGKDHVAAIKFILDNLSRESPRGSKLYAWVNPTYNPQGVESFRVAREFAKSTPFFEHEKLTPPYEIHLNNGTPGKVTAVIKFFSAENPDSLRGGQYDGVVINEAGIVKKLADLWNEVISAMLIDRQGWCWIMGTPKGKNDFHKFFQRGLIETTKNGSPNPWHSFRFPTHANPFIQASELQRIREEVPEEVYKQEYLGEFLDGGGSVFRGLAAMKARSLDLKLIPQWHNCRVGIDIGKHTDFTVLSALNEKNQLIGFDRFNHQDWKLIKHRIRAFCTKYVGKVKIDVAGSGDPIYEELRDLGLAIEPAKFTNEAKTQWVRNLMLQIEEGTLTIPPPNSVSDPSHNTAALWSELETYTFEMLPSGRVRYQAPAGFHDDCVTSLFLAASMVPLMDVQNLTGNHEHFNLHDLPEIGESQYT